ncbi:uncharacterized protein LOC112906430 [Agrilus planipennis]|uniref:Uncharacterized protein LOC112906430 n=1 Tax=Agrilus planipennis TaxID=224129 RepID=A0A7F5RJZ0_AGRPL|nr:uncharacterized protein LOC112906430 [Agrilus planipennis]
MITCGIKNQTIRERLLQEDDLKLDKAVDLCQVIESAKAQSQIISQGQGTSSSSLKCDIDQLQTKQRGKSQGKFITNCNKCGMSKHPVNKCPAFGKSCKFCGKLNHFASVCFKNTHKVENNQNNQVTHKDSVNEVLESKVNANVEFLYVGSINETVAEINLGNQWRTELNIAEKTVSFKIDTGAMANVLPFNMFSSLGLSKNIIRKTNTMLNSYTGDKLKVLGKCEVPCIKDGNTYLLNFFVVNSNTEAILGLETSINLKLIMKIDRLNKIKNEYSNIIEKFKDVFNGIGCFGSPYQIIIDKNAKPIVHPTMKVALPLLDSLKKALLS